MRLAASIFKLSALRWALRIATQLIYYREIMDSMRLYIIMSLALAIYLIYSMHVSTWAEALSAVELAIAASFGLIASLIPVAGPVLYVQLLTLVQSWIGVALPPLAYTVLTWLSFALSSMSTLFLVMYVMQTGRWAAKRAFRFLLLW